MDYSSILSALIGGTVAIFVKYFFDKRKEDYFNLNKIMEDKYRSLLIFMACSLDIKKKKHFTLSEQYPAESEKEYLEKVKEYYYHSLLYSPDEVLLKLKKFIQDPTQGNYIEVAKAMRKDLWRRKTKLTEKDIIIK
ncbi:MAG: hypothetical protein WC349_00805 [Patescibacteria group bacterium]|jgi:uncharacterized membrane protein YgaE (UPF0421/DUF939 family)